MKKFVLFILGLIVFGMLAQSQAAVFNVDNVAALQNALTTAQNNREVDTINIAARTYNVTTTLTYNTITENFPLIVRGAGKGLTILDGGVTTQIMNINTSALDPNAHVTIKNITFQNGFKGSYVGISTLGAGVSVYSSSADVTMEYCEFKGNTGSKYGGGVFLLSDNGIVTLRNSTFSNNSADWGGGACAWSLNGTVTLENNTFHNNSATLGGGAHVFADNGTLILTNNTFRDNLAERNGDGGGVYTGSIKGIVTVINNNFDGNSAEHDGGGMHVYSISGTVTLTNNTFINNSADDRGGGTDAGSNEGKVTLTNNIFKDNSAGDRGGGTYVRSSSDTVTLTNNIFSGNSAEHGGGAYASSSKGTVNLTNNTFTHNLAEWSGGGLYVYLGSSDDATFANIYNNIIWDNTGGTVSDLYVNDKSGDSVFIFNNNFSDFRFNDGNNISSGNNMDEEPLLTNVYHLQVGSPCVNKGANNAPELPDLDIDGDPRIANGIVDIGADELSGRNRISLSTYKGGNAGSVTVTIFGSDFTQGTIVKLVKDSKKIMGEDIVIKASNRLITTFDLLGAAPGLYDIVVTIPDGETIICEKCFTVEEGGEENLWVQIIGREQMRAKRKQKYIIRYGNSGNINARYPWLAIGIPHDTSYEIDVTPAWYPHSSSEPYGKDHVKIILLDLLPIPPGESSTVPLEITHKEIGSINMMVRITTDPSPYFSSLLSLPERVLPVLGTDGVVDDCDVTGDEDYPSGTMLFWYTDEKYPIVDGNGNVIPGWHIAKSIGCGQFIDIMTDGLQIRSLDEHWTDRPNFRFLKSRLDSPEHRKKIRETSLALYDNLKDNFVYTSDICDSEYNHEKEELTTNCLGLFHILNPELRRDRSYLIDQIYEANSKGERWFVDKVFKTIGFFHDAGECGKGLWDLERGTLKVIYVIQSISPEDKYGPTGYDPEGTQPGYLKRYIKGDNQMSYKIDFWNKEKAPAATVDVTIKDELDDDLDWKTFEFTETGFLDWNVQLEPTQYFHINIQDVKIDLSQYFLDYYKQYPNEPKVVNLIVNVEGNFDPETGQIEWQFHALDPLTNEPPELPIAGFLPPITDTGYEIGWVNYNVSPKKDLPTGAKITNQAWVKFDTNDPNPAPPNPDSEIPGYGPYLNTVDNGAPACSVSPLPSKHKEYNFTINWEGNDDAGGSGIKDYDIYVSHNDEPYYLWITTSETSAEFSGEIGHSYSFYCRARDNVGNIEDEPDEADTSTTVLKYYTLTVKKKGKGTVISSPVGIKCGSECIAQFPEGTKVKLKARAGKKSIIKGWSGCKKNKRNKKICTVTMNKKNKRVSAKFSSKNRK